MERREMANKGLYFGTGAGLVLFALVGLLPGSLIGGVIGLKVAGSIFDAPMGAAILPRMVLAVSMIMGIVTAAMVCVLGSGVLGWSMGFVVDGLTGRERVPASVTQTTR